MVTGDQNKATPNISLGTLPKDRLCYNQWGMSSTLASLSEACTVTPEAQTSKTLVLGLNSPTPNLTAQQVSLISASPWLPTSGINVLLMAASEF